LANHVPYGVERGELADGISAHGAAVSGTGEVEQRASVPSPRVEAEELEDCLLHPEYLLFAEVRAKLGEQADQVQDDDEGAIEVGHVPVPGRVGSGGVEVLFHGRLSASHLLNGLLKDSHDITKVDWRVRTRAGERARLLLLPLVRVGVGCVGIGARTALAHHEAEELGKAEMKCSATLVPVPFVGQKMRIPFSKFLVFHT
jgi:hypothetical protein